MHCAEPVKNMDCICEKEPFFIDDIMVRNARSCEDFLCELMVFVKTLAPGKSDGFRMFSYHESTCASCRFNADIEVGFEAIFIKYEAMVSDRT